MTALTMAPVTTPATNAADAAIPFQRLVRVELRKLVDTRSGRWLLLGLAAIVALTLGIGGGTADADGRSFERLLALANQPTSAIIPILGILAATSEWSKRTVLTTFAVTPRRERVVGAKVAASLVLVLAAVAMTILFAAVAAILLPLFTTTETDWSVGASDLGEFVVYQSLYMLFGLALGALIINAAAAIVTFLMLPPLWLALTAAFPKLTETQEWIDPGITWERLVSTETMTATAWQHLAVTALVWLVVPFALGIRRQLRREVD